MLYRNIFCVISLDLKALILSSNRLSGLTGLSALKDLNTLGMEWAIVDLTPVLFIPPMLIRGLSKKKFSSLVLSHNCFKSISVERLTKLAKLSLSHNSLRAIPNVQVWNQMN